MNFTFPLILDSNVICLQKNTSKDLCCCITYHFRTRTETLQTVYIGHFVDGCVFLLFLLTLD
jgi:hypothetical protein